MNIPLDEAMAALDTDYASEACTCEPDDENQQEGENLDDGLRVDMAKRRQKAGVGETAKMVVGPVWRNPDVSTSQETNKFDDAHLIMSVHRLCSLAYLQKLQREATGQ